jgi:hypothetical protein
MRLDPESQGAPPAHQSWAAPTPHAATVPFANGQCPLRPESLQGCRDIDRLKVGEDPDGHRIKELAGSQRGNHPPPQGCEPSQSGHFSFNSRLIRTPTRTLSPPANSPKLRRLSSLSSLSPPSSRFYKENASNDWPCSRESSVDKCTRRGTPGEPCGFPCLRGTLHKTTQRTRARLTQDGEVEFMSRAPELACFNPMRSHCECWTRRTRARCHEVPTIKVNRQHSGTDTYLHSVPSTEYPPSKARQSWYLRRSFRPPANATKEANTRYPGWSRPTGTPMPSYL